jgi:hypothetical protein
MTLTPPMRSSSHSTRPRPALLRRPEPRSVWRSLSPFNSAKISRFSFQIRFFSRPKPSDTSPETYFGAASGSRLSIAGCFSRHLQLEAAMLTPNRLALNLRNAVARCLASGGLAADFVPAWPEGVTQMVHSKPQPERPYLIFTTVLPGCLWFEGTAGAQEIEMVWMSAGRLRDDYDFAELDQICAKVHGDLQSQFQDIVSTKMNPVPMRLMSAGAAFTQRDPAVRAAQRSLLRSGGHF